MKLFNRTKKEEQNKEQNNTEIKNENKVLKFARNFAIGLAVGATILVANKAIAAANSDDDSSESDTDEFDLDNVKNDDSEFGDVRYDSDIDDAFATVAYADGDIGFVGKDYIMNLAQRLAENEND